MPRAAEKVAVVALSPLKRHLNSTTSLSVSFPVLLPEAWKHKGIMRRSAVRRSDVQLDVTFE